jgi:hypothetical protein
MIIKGGRAGNVGFWSGHLLRTDTNARAELKEARGVVASDLHGALREMQAIAGASRCGTDFMYQANINPLAHEHLTPDQWTTAIDRLEKNLGFEGHARVVVEHVKESRQHVHVIWNRVDDELRTVSPWRNYETHERTARQLEREFDLEPTPQNGRAANTFALWELQRAEVTQIDPRAVKAEVTQLWQQTDSGQAFTAALGERGYILAKGDRRDFCIIDHAGTVHSLARRLDGVNAADVRARMSDIERDTLPTVAEARASQHERYRNDPAALWRQDEETARTQNAGAGEFDLAWSDRAGMVAQQRAAMENTLVGQAARELRREAKREWRLKREDSPEQHREQTAKIQELGDWINARTLAQRGSRAREDDGGREL